MKKLCNLKKEDGTYRLYYTALFDSYQINENTIAKSPCEKALLSEFGYLLNTHKQIAIENDRLKETLGLVSSHYNMPHIPSSAYTIDFYNRSLRVTNRIITTFLATLRDHNLIRYKEIKLIKNTSQPATPFDLYCSSRIESQLLETLGCETIQQVWQKGQSKTFYKTYQRLMAEKHGFLLSDGYEITAIQNGWYKPYTKKMYQDAQHIANTCVAERIEKNVRNARKRYEQKLNEELKNYIYISDYKDTKTYQSHPAVRNSDYISIMRDLIKKYILIEQEPP